MKKKLTLIISFLLIIELYFGLITKSDSILHLIKKQSDFDGTLTAQILDEWGYDVNSTQKNISYRGIRSIQEGKFDEFARLEKIDLNYNSFRTITMNTFRGLTNLYDLNLNYNGISSIENSSFSHLNSLKNLDLSSNNIEVINAEMFKGMKKLTRLDLFDNLIHTIEDNAFSDLEELEIVYFNNNMIEEIGSKINF